MNEKNEGLATEYMKKVRAPKALEKALGQRSPITKMKNFNLKKDR